MELLDRGGLVGDGVGLRGQGLEERTAHEIDGLVADGLAGGQHLVADPGDSAGQLVDGFFQLLAGDRLPGPADLGGLLAAEGIAGEEGPLGPLGTDQVGPHVGCRCAQVPDGREADLGILRHDDDVAVHGDVGARRQAVAVDLTEDRLADVPQVVPLLTSPAHVVDIPLEIGPLVFPIDAFRAGGDVVSGAEGAPGRFDHDAPDVPVRIRFLQGSPEVTLEPLVEGVELFGPVQRYPADVVVGLIRDELVFHLPSLSKGRASIHERWEEGIPFLRFRLRAIMDMVRYGHEPGSTASELPLFG